MHASNAGNRWLGITATLLLALVIAPASAVTISNTATVSFLDGPTPRNITSNTVTLETIPPPAPAIVEFLRFAPGSPGSVATPADGGSCQDGMGAFSPLPPVTDSAGANINVVSAPIFDAASFQLGEAVFVRLTDANRNLDPLLRDFIDLRITTSTGDEEVLRLQETAIDTGMFVTALQGVAMPPAATRFDCRLSVVQGASLLVEYIDILFPADMAQDSALVDPFGVVFDSSTGAPVNGVTVNLLDALTGLPATVFGVDGSSSYPSTVSSGAVVSDASGRSYTQPPGGFQFPVVAPGTYILQVTPPATYGAPSVVALVVLQALLDPAGNPYVVGQGSFGDAFARPAAPGFRVDIPIDPVQTGLLLQKRASTTEVSAGEFLQYRLTLQNLNTVGAIVNAEISDTLPPGLRYQAGSLRIAGQPAADPIISADGQGLTIAVGTLVGGGVVDVSYVVQVSAGAHAGDAINRATATASGGLESNVAVAAVRIREPFFSGQFTIIGRVVEGECNTPWHELKGVPQVRMLLDDGTYVPTDRDGQFHFEGVRPGTHVVQLDLDSLPPELEVTPCLQNSRFAGRSFSQFVEAQGGSLWRTDFYLRRRDGQVGIRLHSALVAEDVGGALAFRMELDGGRVAVQKLAATAQLPEGVSFTPGSARVDGVAVADPVFADGYLTFRLGDPGAHWRHVIEFGGRAAGAVRPGEVREHTLRAQFDSGMASLKPEGAVAVNDLIATLQGTSIRRIAVVGHTDRQLLTAARTKIFADNIVLSQARAQTVAQALARGLGMSMEQFSTDGKGPGEPLVVEDTPADRAVNRRVDVIVFSEDAETIAGLDCPTGGYLSKAVASFVLADKASARTPMAESALACVAVTERSESDSHRQATTVTGAGELLDAAATTQQAQVRRQAIVGSAQAAGAETNWLDQQSPGMAWLFPAAGHNPRAPTQRVVIKHEPGQTVALKYRGQAVDPLNFDGTRSDAAQTVAISSWRGLPLRDGENYFTAEVMDAHGAVVRTLSHTVHYANQVARAELVPEESVLVADGLQRPVIAVRMLDRSGHPVRHGVTGAYRLNAPYVAAPQLDGEQQRQLAGLDRHSPTFRIEGDNGVAYIELAPTTASGSVVLGFSFPRDERTTHNAELRVWLEAQPRDWVVVGFAAGTVAYNTLSGNMQALAGSGEEDGGYTDGQVSLYAKGQVLGKWLLTLAYDSSKPTGRQGRSSVLSTIDPNSFYTLYGDGSGQLYDGASAEKLYLKLERDQFYALVGDYETGLDQTELSRYSRTLTGIKSEFRGERISFTGFVADTAQNFARDEIHGNGTSGLYRLSRGRIVINGEQLRIETRDRFRSEIIVSSRQLRRHLDYDIDYDAGTLLFREPINSRDFNFNPIFIVAEYETVGTADKHLNAGGRIGVQLLDDRLSMGATLLRDEAAQGKSNLGGIDAKFQITPETELRIEGAMSDGSLSNRDGSAYLAEVEHHSGTLDALAYVRRQSPGFGVNQQNAAEGGTLKAGLDAQLRLNEWLAVQGQVYREENLDSATTREVATTGLEYRGEHWGVRAGAQLAQDEAITGEKAESRQVTVGAHRRFLDQKLELMMQNEFSLGGDNDSVDFPSRYRLGAAYALSEDVRLVASHEITDGEDFDSSTTRLGVEVKPWKGARLSSTLNQSEISEYGPRTFALFGLTQSLLVGERWGFDLSTDASHTMDHASTAPLVINEHQPMASGGVLGNGALTEDFVALSGGATYRAPLWSWTGRVESRDGQTSDRNGFTTGFLRQAKAGVAFAASGQAFRVDQASGSQGLLANVSLSWAYRPLGRQWSLLERLEYRHDELSNGSGLTGGGLFGANSLAINGDAKSRRLINNLVMNRVSRAWQEEDTRGNLFELNQRSQWSLYYGSKYVFDRFDGRDYSGYTDMLGTEWRYDITRKIDVGLRGSVLHAWRADNYEYSAGPVVGFSPFENAWISVGYNLHGFHDRDFASAHYTAQGPYLTLRFKFDQSTRPGVGESGASP